MVPFYGRITEWTPAQLKADIELCRKVLSDGAFNGFPLDSDDAVEWLDWLHDFEVEAEMLEDETVEAMRRAA